jgi:hypothetical protein
MWIHRSRSQFRAPHAITLMFVLASFLAIPSLVDAQREDRPGREDHQNRREDRHQDARASDRRDERGYVLDNRYNHNHFYPPRGYAVPALPRGYVSLRFGPTPYYFHEGVFYRPDRFRFVVVAPPIGLIVPLLPPFYTTIWAGGVPYYYADDAYYAWSPERRGYVVTNPPADADAGTQPAPQSDLFIYPKNGQSEQQQAQDRYECHSWASSQTGFDPTQPAGGVPESQAQTKRDDYQRAMTACLEARGYSVK